MIKNGVLCWHFLFKFIRSFKTKSFFGRVFCAKEELNAPQRTLHAKAKSMVSYLTRHIFRATASQ